jgi:hypothetical protein
VQSGECSNVATDHNNPAPTHALDNCPLDNESCTCHFTYVRTFHRLHLLQLWTPTIYSIEFQISYSGLNSDHQRCMFCRMFCQFVLSHMHSQNYILAPFHRKLLRSVTEKSRPHAVVGREERTRAFTILKIIFLLK